MSPGPRVSEEELAKFLNTSTSADKILLAMDLFDARQELKDLCEVVDAYMNGGEKFLDDRPCTFACSKYHWGTFARYENETSR